MRPDGGETRLVKLLRKRVCDLPPHLTLHFLRLRRLLCRKQPRRSDERDTRQGAGPVQPVTQREGRIFAGGPAGSRGGEAWAAT